MPRPESESFIFSLVRPAADNSVVNARFTVNEINICRGKVETNCISRPWTYTKMALAHVLTSNRATWRGDQNRARPER